LNTIESAIISQFYWHIEKSYGKTRNEKSSGEKQKAVNALGEIAKLIRFCITFPTKHTNNKSKIAGILNMKGIRVDY
jgi:hypothetical protein